MFPIGEIRAYHLRGHAIGYWAAQKDKKKKGPEICENDEEAPPRTRNFNEQEILSDALPESF